MIEIIGHALSQWDVGRSVQITGIEADHAHFANKGDSKAVIMGVADTKAKIPDYLLQTGKQLCVYAVKDGITVESKTFYVQKRERPDDYIYTEAEIKRWDSLEKRVDALEEGGSGITAAEKELILSLFRNAAYTADMSATISRLESLWSGSGDEPDAPVEPDIPDEPSVITHNVTKKLDGVSTSNSATSVVNGASYVCNLTAHDGYTLDGAKVSVAMGGKDITSTAYSNGVINIAAVTGDVDITVVAKEIRIYSVTNNLTGVTNSNPQTEVTEGFYSASLSWESGYELNSLVITMGGVDITADVYGEGNILITEVTGDIVITAEAGLPAPVYLLENKTFDGSAGQIIDTGIALFDTQKDWSIYIALTTSDESSTSGRAACWHKSVESTYPNAVNVGRGQWNTNWFVRAVTVQYQVSDNLAKCAVIITHTKEKNTHKYYGVVGGEIVTGDLPSRGVGTDGTLKIGGSYDYAETKEAELFIGTINTAEVHLRVLTEAEIKEKLGVA